jgi:hypothetical protein
MMEAAGNSETLVNFYQTTRCYNPEDSHLHATCLCMVMIYLQTDVHVSRCCDSFPIATTPTAKWFYRFARPPCCSFTFYKIIPQRKVRIFPRQISRPFITCTPTINNNIAATVLLLTGNN